MSTFNAAPIISLWHKDQTRQKKCIMLLLGIALVVFSAQLSIPLKPVPLTFQSTVVILLGMVYGWRGASQVVLGYFAAGLMGLPVFADWSFGPQVFLGTTGGYLIGLLPASMLSGYLAERGWGRSYLSSFMAASFALFIIFILGLMQLSLFVGIKNSIQLGLQPFIYTESCKLLIVTYLLPKLWR